MRVSTGGSRSASELKAITARAPQSPRIPATSRSRSIGFSGTAIAPSFHAAISAIGNWGMFCR